MKLNFKTKRRRFELKFCLPFPMGINNQYAKEVIESIEQDELLVFDPKDEEGLSSAFSDDGALLLLEKATIPVKIIEWLPVCCQMIRYAGSGDEFRDNAIAHYKSNAQQVLWPPYTEHKPEGPAAFIGEIVIKTPDFLGQSNLNYKTARYRDSFKCLIAHELVHVFDSLRFIVPAFLNWRSFWHTFVDEGCSTDILCSRLDNIGSFVDKYGSQLELSCLREYWPSQGKKWFNAFHRDTKQKKRKQIKKKGR